ncbi:hypothetical protein FBALC1_08363 [Flavobacteriales bacterium ALC-1]|nr:hypothetical protein FBALC1_08363 [Flavobacteriales bacterium ALC-1]
MNKPKFIFLIFLLIANFSQSQIQKDFFVDDANGVDFLRVKFCVNDEAKIFDVESIANESTYENKYVINQIKEYLLGIEFYENSKLKNDCHYTTLRLINSKYENIDKKGKDIPKDFSLLKGEYRYKNPFYNQTKIIRKKKIQREKAKDEKQIYFIEWISDSEYNLIYKRMTDRSLRKYIGKVINVKILDIFPDGSYIYKSTAEHFDWVTYGMMLKIK